MAHRQGDIPPPPPPLMRVVREDGRVRYRPLGEELSRDIERPGARCVFWIVVSVALALMLIGTYVVN